MTKLQAEVAAWQARLEAAEARAARPGGAEREPRGGG